MKHDTCKYKLLLGWTLLQLTTAISSAQIVTISETLKRMSVDALAIGLPIQATGTVALDRFCPGKFASVTISKGILIDMRLNLFPANMVKQPNTIVYDFMERYLFSLLLKKTKTEQLNLLREDFVSLKVNGRLFSESQLSITGVLQQIKPETPFTLTADKFYYHACWKTHNQQGKVELVFPKQYDLILGKDKKELTYLVKDELQQFLFANTGQQVKPQLLQWDPLKLIYTDIQDTYILPQVKRGYYLQQKGNAYTYIFSERLAEESILNLFSNADNMNETGKKALMLTIRGYNYTDTLPYTTDRLCAFMKAHQCLAYIGIEEVAETFITGTVFYVNPELAYKHMLYFRFPKNVFKKDDDMITATLYPYIPIGNIGNLYGDVNFLN